MTNATKDAGIKVDYPMTDESIAASIAKAFADATAGNNQLAAVSKSRKYKWQGVLLVTRKKAIQVTLPLTLLRAMKIDKGKADAIGKALVAQGGNSASAQEQVTSSKDNNTADADGVSNQLQKVLGNKKNIYRPVKVKVAEKYNLRANRKSDIVGLRIHPTVPLAAIGIGLFHLNEAGGAGSKALTLISPGGEEYLIPQTLDHAKKIASELGKAA